MFSGDQRPVQPKQNVRENLAQSATTSPGQNVPLGKSNSSTDPNVVVSSHGQLNNTLRECGTQKQKEACNSTVTQRSYPHLETSDDDRVHQAELVEVVDEDDEISNLQTAIHSLQQATIGAKSLYLSSQEKQKLLVQESSKESIVSATAGNVKHSRKKADLPQENEDQKEYPSELQSASNIISEHKSNRQHKNTETCCIDTKSEAVQTTEACIKIGQKGTGMVQGSTMVSVYSSETTPAQTEDEEVVFQGKLQAALNSLERSNINVIKGDFRAAMIYRNSSKRHKEISQNVDAVSVQKPTKEESCPVTEPKSTPAPLRQEVSIEQVTAANDEPPTQSETPNKTASSAVLEKSKRPVGPKPAIPQKPEHLKVKEGDIQSTNTKNPEATQTNTVRPEETVPQPLPMTSLSRKDGQKKDLKINSCANTGPDLVGRQRNELLDEAIVLSQETEARFNVQGSVITLLRNKTDKSITGRQQEINVTAEEISPQDFSVKENMQETDESHVDFHEACKKFGGKKARQAKNAPVKPKRVKIAQPDNKNPKHMSGDNNSPILTHVVEQPQKTLAGPSRNNPNTHGQTADRKGKQEKEMKQESKVEMREKKGRTETEDERRQRLSVHMDEIMRGNITAAMEIFDNLRKQEELQSILSRVEEIEQDTSGVDVRSLRGVFESVPDWVVCSDKKKHKKVKAENKGERMLLTRDNTESKSSMAHVFGDLERASEEIMNLKEQTLARLMDIEGAIKKALYSVSTLKSDSDIAGLSCLFKESLGTVQGSPTSGNISKISIGSSRTKSLESSTTKGSPPLPVSQSASTEGTSAKHRVSPPCSPAFISIQSAARKAGKSEVLPPETTICPTCQHSPKTEEKFCTTKILTCNSPAQNRKRDPRKGGQKQSSHNPLNPKRELSVLELQTDREGNSIMGTTTVTENYERTDNLGNRFYSSKTSTVVTTQPETATSTGQAVVSQVTKYPEVRPLINQKP
ncbi:xin actin-binding repeat-containing protein 1-like [Symphorus nematophorus]